ncbi:MAG: hypothetical protein OXT09_13795 [Myxococcales bacterium]|nr:hypothetical protein [Myxococcales bacterium]
MHQGGVIEAPATAGAMCAQHPTLRAGVTCTRCGDYLCSSCIAVRAEGAAYCKNCSKTHFEAIRQEHIKHEASVRSIGMLYYVGAGMYLLTAIMLMVGALGDEEFSGAGLGVLMLFLVAIPGLVGWGIRRLKTWARMTSIVLSCIGLLGFPLGTLINGYILYLLLSAKGRMIFSDEYRQVVEATPHVKYRTSVVVLVLFGLLVLLVLFGIGAALMGN